MVLDVTGEVALTWAVNGMASCEDLKCEGKRGVWSHGVYSAPGR